MRRCIYLCNINYDYLYPPSFTKTSGTVLYIYLVMVHKVIWTHYLAENKEKNRWKYKNLCFKALENWWGSEERPG